MERKKEYSNKSISLWVLSIPGLPRFLLIKQLPLCYQNFQSIPTSAKYTYQIVKKYVIGTAALIMDKRIKTTEKNITTVKNLNTAKDKCCQGQILQRTNTAKDKYCKGQILPRTNTAKMQILQRTNTAKDKYCQGQILPRTNTAKDKYC